MHLLSTLVSISLPILAIALAGPTSAQRQPEDHDGVVDFPSLLRRMTDLESLATRRPTGTRHVQFSSYDRRSRGPGATPARKKAIDTDPLRLAPWFANGDRGKYLRVDQTSDGRAEAVLADVAGPGYLARIWSANPTGTLRIYVDDNVTPVIEGPMVDVMGGRISLFPPPLAGKRARGYTFYVPIPFAKRLRVTCEEPERLYYHVNVIRFPQSVRVRSLAADDLPAHGLDLFRAARDLSATARPPRPPLQIPFRVGPGRKWTMGWRPWRDRPVLRDLLFSGVKADDLARALRQTLIIMEFDGVETVRAPLAEFFGCGPRGGDWRGLGVGAVRSHDGLSLYCRFVFPLERDATLYLLNRSNVELSGLVSWVDAESTIADRGLRLHASYREWPRTPTRPPRDLTLLDVEGAGHVVGCNLTVANPLPTWWGEGDEKIFVDGETFPSIFGTGTEDYIGYAWCDTTCYSHPYHALSNCDGPANRGVASGGRTHVIDPIPFDRSIRFDLELLHWKPCSIDYATTVFYYAAPTSRDRGRFPADGTPHWAPITVAYPTIEGAIEAETLAASATGGKTKAVYTIAPWSGRGQREWCDAEPGDTLTITFDAPSDGRFRVRARFTLGPNHGRHKLTINGAAHAFEADFFAAELTPFPPIDLGIFTLRKTGNRMVVRCIGSRARALPGRAFGLDCLELEAVPAKND